MCVCLEGLVDYTEKITEGNFIIQAVVSHAQIIDNSGKLAGRESPVRSWVEATF